MKYFTLVAVVIALTSCCHTRYSESHVPPTLLFKEGDDVRLSSDSVPCKLDFSVCKDTAVVMSIVDFKNNCYPQASYEIKFYHRLETYLFCAADLILITTETK